MGKARFVNLGDLASTTNTTAVDVSELESVAVAVGGTFVGTFSIEVSFDEGVTFIPHASGTGKTAPFVLDLGMRVQQVRVDCTAYTSGTMNCGLSGTDEDRKG